MNNRFNFNADEIVYSRFFSGAALVVVSCNGSIAVLRDATKAGTFALPVGELTRVGG